MACLIMTLFYKSFCFQTKLNNKQNFSQMRQRQFILHQKRNLTPCLPLGLGDRCQTEAKRMYPLTYTRIPVSFCWYKHHKTICSSRAEIQSADTLKLVSHAKLIATRPLKNECSLQTTCYTIGWLIYIYMYYEEYQNKSRLKN